MQTQVINTSVIEITSIVMRSPKTLAVELEPGTILILTMDQALLDRTQAKLDEKPAPAPAPAPALAPAKVETKAESKPRFKRGRKQRKECTLSVPLDETLGVVNYTNKYGKTKPQVAWKIEGDKYRMLFLSQCGKYGEHTDKGWLANASQVASL